jgi:hypothetical protein
MIKRYFLFFLVPLMFVTACSKKSVQLPLIEAPGLTDIQNHSSIWIFMETREGDTLAAMNKNNKILNTHWIFNIDRRLNMEQVVPFLVQMQENRNKDSMHKKEGMENYFSYADPSSEKIRLFPFTKTTYNTSFNEPDSPDCIAPLYLTRSSIHFKERNFDYDSIGSITKILDSCRDDDVMKVRLILDGKATFQNYLRTKVELFSNGVPCDPVEYIHSVK